jgi:DNA-binding transcriptional ArsR family regulator
MSVPRAATSSDVFNAVAEPQRRAILDFLVDRARPVNDVAEALKLGQPSVSKHLRVLREVGLVTARRAGRQQLYEVNAMGLKPMHDWTKTYERFWAHQLDRIRQRAERKAKERTSAKQPPLDLKEKNP